MIPLSVSEISALDGFCDEHEQEWGILVVLVVLTSLYSLIVSIYIFIAMAFTI